MNEDGEVWRPRVGVGVGSSWGMLGGTTAVASCCWSTARIEVARAGLVFASEVRRAEMLGGFVVVLGVIAAVGVMRVLSLCPPWRSTLMGGPAFTKGAVV